MREPSKRRPSRRTAAESARDAADSLAEPLGVRLGDSSRERRPARPSPVGIDPGVVELRLDNGRWFVDSPYGRAHVADSIGMGQIVALVTAPGRDVAAVDLVGGELGAVVVTSDLGPALDARAKREYRRRLAELQEEIDDAAARDRADGRLEMAGPDIITAWQCIGCGRLESHATCLGICEYHKVELVRAGNGTVAPAAAPATAAVSDGAQVRAMRELLARIAHTNPRGDQWEASYRAMQRQARAVLAKEGSA